MSLDLWHDTVVAKISLFVANLAFDATETLEVAKVGILAASLVSGIAGALFLTKGGTACIRLDTATT